jgi:hypothetical protein
MIESDSKRSSKTDWSRVDALGDSEIDVADVPELDEGFFSRAALRLPSGEVQVSLRLDPSLFSWFESQPGNPMAKMKAALRIYKAAHESEDDSSIARAQVTSVEPNPAPGKRMLESEFDAAMMDVYRRAKDEAHYPANQFLSMLLQQRGLRTAQTLLHVKGVSTGYTALYERGRLDLTVEAVIIDNPKFHVLFTAEELEIARARLRDYKYPPAMKAASA